MSAQVAHRADVDSLIYAVFFLVSLTVALLFFYSCPSMPQEHLTRPGSLTAKSNVVAEAQWKN